MRVPLKIVDRYLAESIDRRQYYGQHSDKRGQPECNQQPASDLAFRRFDCLECDDLRTPAACAAPMSQDLNGTPQRFNQLIYGIHASYVVQWSGSQELGNALLGKPPGPHEGEKQCPD
jgi:hypothetical protein